MRSKDSRNYTLARKRRNSKADTDRTPESTDAAEGRLFPSFVLFLLPLIGANILQQSYGVADGMILGNAINQEALGSVSSVGPLIDVATLIQIGIAGGCAIVVSHLYGAKRHEELNNLIYAVRRLLTLVSLGIAAAAFLLAPWVVRVMHTPEALYDGAVLYMRICFAGVPFTSLYSLHSGILRGMGDSKRPLGAIAVASFINIGLDLICVVLLDWGIAGAAVATVAAEIMAAAYLYMRLEQSRKQLIPAADASPSPAGQPDETDHSASSGTKANVVECVRLGVPQMVQSVVTSGGKVLLQNLINMLGSVVVIGVAAAFKVDSFLFTPLFSMSVAVSVFTGQNLGAGRPDRAKQTVKYGAAVMAAFSAAIALIMWWLGPPLFRLFGLDAAAVETGYRYLMICLPFYWVFGLQNVLSGYLSGSKQTIIPAVASIAGLIGRLVFAYAGYERFGPDVLPMAESLSWCIGAVIGLIGVWLLRPAERNEKGKQ